MDGKNMEEIKNLSEDLKRITENQEESDNNALTLSCILEKYRDILTNMSGYLNEHFTFIEQLDFRITREKWSLQGPYWSESDINNEFPEYFDKLMKAETSKMEKIERINCVNSNLHTILTWLKEENDRWVIKTKSDLSWMQTEGCVEELQNRNKQIHSVIDLLNQICTLPLAHCEEVIVTEMKRNFIEANYQVIEILKQKNVREDALKKQIESKLSRIRKRCYIALDAENAADFAKVYSKEVEKYLRRFKIARREHTKWKNKMKQTTNAVLKITMDSVNEKECHEDTGVAVLKREDETETSNDNKEKNLPQEILDIPDSCEEKAVREDFAEKNVVENPKDDENVNPMDDAVVKEDSDENIMDPPDVFSNNPHIEDEDDEFTLPNVPEFNISGDHEKKWLAKIEKTVHDSSKLTPPSHIQGMEEENGKEDHSVTNVAVEKIGDDNENDLAALEMDPVKDNQCHEDTGAESANDDFVNHAQYNPQAKENTNLPDVPEDDPTDDDLFARLYTLKRFNRKLAQEKTKNVLSEPMQDINILEGNKMIPYDPDTHGAEEGSGQNEPIMSGTPPRTGGCRYPVSSVPGYVEGKNNWFQGGQEQRVTPETVMFYSAQLDAENKESEKPKPQPMIDNNKKNNQQPAVVTGMVLIMLITMVLNSVEQINRKIESPSKNCSCACYIWIKEKYWRTIIECFCLKAETLSSNVKMMIFKMKNNIFLWMKQRKEEILNWTIQFLEAIK